MSEILAREPPYESVRKDQPVAEMIKKIQIGKHPLVRPVITRTEGVPEQLKWLMYNCLGEEAHQRPNTSMILANIKDIMRILKIPDNMVENMIKRMEGYAASLENNVKEATNELVEEKNRTEKILNTILPKNIADKLISGQSVEPEAFANVSLTFFDFVNMPQMAASSTAAQIIELVNDVNEALAQLNAAYDVYKIETNLDGYMVNGECCQFSGIIHSSQIASGLPSTNGSEHSRQVALYVLHLVYKMNSQFRIKHRPEQKLQFRIGCHSGPVAAGVVGSVLPRYCVFGDTTLITEQVEKHAEPAKILVTENMKKELDLNFGSQFLLEDAEELKLGDKITVHTYWLVSDTDSKNRNQPTCVEDVAKEYS